MRKPQHLTQAHAELIATNLLHIFSLHIQPLLRLCYNVGNGTLFDVIKSNSLSSGNGDGDVDIGQLTLNRHFISSKYLERLSTSLIGNLTSKLVLYLSSLCIPGLDLREISGFSSSILQSLSPQSGQQQQQMAERRRLDALDLASPANSLAKRGSVGSTPFGTPSKTTGLSLLNRGGMNIQVNNNVGNGGVSNTRARLMMDDSAIDSFPSSGSTLVTVVAGMIAALPLAAAATAVGSPSLVVKIPTGPNLAVMAPTLAPNNNSTASTWAGIPTVLVALVVAHSKPLPVPPNSTSPKSQPMRVPHTSHPSPRTTSIIAIPVYIPSHWTRPRAFSHVTPMTPFPQSRWPTFPTSSSISSPPFYSPSTTSSFSNPPLSTPSYPFMLSSTAPHNNSYSSHLRSKSPR